MSQGGWIKEYRKTLDHWTWQDRPYAHGQAWSWILLSANHKDGTCVLSGKMYEVKRGSMITSIRKLCEAWGWSNSKVAAFLLLLKNDAMIGYKSDTKKTVISVLNYSPYQNQEETETTQKLHETDDRNDKNQYKQEVKKLRTKKHMPEKLNSETETLFNRFYSEYPRKVARPRALKAWLNLKPQPDEALCEKILRSVKDHKLIWKDKQFVPYPSSFLTSQMFDDELNTEQDTIDNDEYADMIL